MANDRLRGLLSFDPDDPNSQGLLGLGAALLQASGPSREPVSMGQALGQGLQGMQQARQQAIQQQMLRAQMGAKQTTDFQRDLAASGIDPASPEGQRILKNRYDKSFLTPLQQAQLAEKTRELSKPNLTKGQEAVDRKFSDEYVDFKAAGGFADVRKGIDQVSGVLGQLEAGENLTGPVIGRVGDWGRALVAPEAQAAKEAVEEVVQRNLRLVLGAQFTEKEGERLIARAYNPALGGPENAKRLRRLVDQISTAAQAKQEAVDYYDEHGTLAGFKGKTYSMSDFSNIDFDGKGKNDKTEKPKAGGIQFLGFE